MRLVFPIVPVILLLGTLFQGPFSHVHSRGAPDHGHTGTHGTTLHNHFPMARPKTDSTHDESTLEGPHHSGQDIDLLLTTEGKTSPPVGTFRACSNLFPELLVRRLNEVKGSERTRDPPRLGLPPRAPPA